MTYRFRKSIISLSTNTLSTRINIHFSSSLYLATELSASMVSLEAFRNSPPSTISCSPSSNHQKLMRFSVGFTHKVDLNRVFKEDSVTEWEQHYGRRCLSHSMLVKRERSELSWRREKSPHPRYWCASCLFEEVSFRCSIALCYCSVPSKTANW